MFSSRVIKLLKPVQRSTILFPKEEDILASNRRFNSNEVNKNQQRLPKKNNGMTSNLKFWLSTFVGASFGAVSIYLTLDQIMQKKRNANLLLTGSSNPQTNDYKAVEAKLDFDAIGGNEEVIANLADIVRYLQDPKIFNQSGVRAPKNVILSGPPGVGKTMIAEAVAGHAGVPIFMISGSALMDTFVGGTERNLRKLFEEAIKAAPCVLCIDEIDSLGTKRFSNPGHGSELHANTTANQLLTLLSQENPGVIVIATTNNYETLDPALVRAGRFDRHISMSLPDLKERERILGIHTKDKPLGKVSLKELAQLSPQFSGAKLAAWVNEAALVAIRHDSKTIEMNHFDLARTLITYGVIRKQDETNDIQKRQTAIHEAGHALVGHLLNQTIYKVSIIKIGNNNGHTEWLPPENENPSQQEILNNICKCLAGRAAEKIT